MKRVLPFAFLVATATLALLLTHAATYQSPKFLEGWFFPLLYADIVLLAVMAVVVAVFAAQLLVSWRQGRAGARLSLRLAGLFLAVAVLPAAALYAVSAAGIFRGIESWFETPLGRALEKGIDFGQHVLGLEFERLERVSFDIAAQVNRRRGTLLFLLDDLRLFHELESIELFAADGALLVSSLKEPLAAENKLDGGVLKELQNSGIVVRMQGAGRNRRVEVIRRLPPNNEARALRLSRVLPVGIAEGVDEIERGQKEYKKLLSVRRGLKLSFLVTLTLAFVMVLLTVGWVSLRLGRRLAKPLVRMVEATTIIGRGDFGHRLRTTEAKDEVSQLARSFNLMVDDLQQSRTAIGERQAALTKANAHLENLLSSLSVGVLVFDADGRLARINDGADAILCVSLSQLLTKTVRDWQASSSPLLEISAVIKKAMSVPSTEEQRVALQDGKTMTVRARQLSAAAGGGWLVVIDDITRQIQTARAATWVEASRRFVHEIKNPLTPIQLAAERLGKKLEDKLAADDGEMVKRMVATITHQVAAMQKMVNSFRDYSDRPAHALTAVDLNALIVQVASLYSRGGLTLQKNLADDLPAAAGDAVALRQVLHNLLGNAVDAVADVEDARIKIGAQESGSYILLTVEDNGGGVADDILQKVFDPYVTTKSGGTGLGLAMVQKLVEEHGGRVQLQNQNDGAKISVWLTCWRE